MDYRTLLINGIEVFFPYDPYPCQLTYMSRVIEALEDGENGLLESPTGAEVTSYHALVGHRPVVLNLLVDAVRILYMHSLILLIFFPHFCRYW